MKKLFVLLLMAALVAISLAACSIPGTTRNTTAATEAPSATEVPSATEAPSAMEAPSTSEAPSASEAPGVSEAPTVEAAGEATVKPAETAAN